MNKKYSAIKRRAQAKGLIFNLSFELYKQLKMDDCHYCGTHNLFLAHYCNALNLKTPWMTIDRKDNLKGYTPDNVVSACFVCNRIKGNFFTYEDMCKIGKEYVQPKLKLYEQEAMDDFEEYCKYNVCLDEDDETDYDEIGSIL